MEYFRPTVPGRANLPYAFAYTRPVFANRSHGFHAEALGARIRIHTHTPGRCSRLRVFTGKREGATIRLPSGLGLPLFAYLSFSLFPSLPLPPFRPSPFLSLSFSLSFPLPPLLLSCRPRASSRSLASFVFMI
ncbi:hypothetical protein PUN28_005370 [Cardiocondyla obscurior]|uniref:Uncharacterized protein n=1 Tax=Cardiocondyla obscurior TaxID=286306 RepID=A0AAW2GIC4_9HYME